MKMIDVSEVSELNKERQERQTKEQKMTARKRKIMEAAAAKGLAAKKSKPNEGETLPTNQDPPPPVAGESPRRLGRLEQAAAAALMEQQQQQAKQPLENAAMQAPGAVAAAAPMPGSKEELDTILAKSNKLTEENRVRVKQFWLDRVNPTPEMPVVRMKLHEERNIDPESGMTVKETDYLELDYTTFVFKKLRKIKKK